MAKKKKNKYSFFKLLRKAIKDTVENYKKHKAEVEEKRKFRLASDYDWLLLEQLIKQVNENPMLTVVITKPDGTKVHIKAYEEEKKHTLDQLLNMVDLGEDL